MFTDRLTPHEYFGTGVRVPVFIDRGERRWGTSYPVLISVFHCITLHRTPLPHAYPPLPLATAIPSGRNIICSFTLPSVFAMPNHDTTTDSRRTYC